MPGTVKEEWRGGALLTLAAFFGMSLQVLVYLSTSAFIAPLEAEFGWSRALISSTLSIMSVFNLLFSPGLGGIVDRIGSRRIALAGTVAFCAAGSLLGLANGSRWQWWGLGVLVAVTSLAVQAPVWTAPIARHFRASRGLALALAISGSSVATAVAPPVAGLLIEALGWRLAYPALFCLFGGIVLPVAWLFFRQPPGIGNPDRTPDREAPPPSGIPFAAAVRTRQFVQICISITVLIFVLGGTVVHLVPTASEHGMPRHQALSMVSFVGIGSLVGRLASGYFLDRVEPRFYCATIFALPVVSFLMLQFLSLNFAIGAAAALAIGIAAGAEIEAAAFLIARYFGLASFAALFGILVGLISVASGAGATFVGYVHDVTGSYAAAILGAIPLCLLSSTLLVFLGRPARQPS